MSSFEFNPDVVARMQARHEEEMNRKSDEIIRVMRLCKTGKFYEKEVGMAVEYVYRYFHGPVPKSHVRASICDCIEYLTGLEAIRSDDIWDKLGRFREVPGVAEGIAGRIILNLRNSDLVVHRGFKGCYFYIEDVNKASGMVGRELAERANAALRAKNAAEKERVGWLKARRKFDQVKRRLKKLRGV